MDIWIYLLFTIIFHVTKYPSVYIYGFVYDGKKMFYGNIS